jgi:hypothetical protein
MQTITLQTRERMEPAIATGMWIGLWIGEVLAAGRYWLTRAMRGLGKPMLALTCICFAGAASLTFHGVRAFSGAVEMERFAQLDLKALTNGLDRYRGETGFLPARLEDLVPKYLKALHTDPWGHNYVLYRGPGGFALVSAGPDGALNTADDLVLVNGISQDPRMRRAHLSVELAGIRVVESGPLSYLARLGLREGDLIRKIDGKAQGTLEPMSFFYPRPSDTRRVEIEIERDRQRMTLSFEWRDGEFVPVDHRERGEQ